MVAVLLGILKVVGLILLGILGLILLVVLAVLLVPIRFSVAGSMEEKKPRGQAAVSWLLRILSVCVSYEEELDVVIRIFGFRIGGGDSGGEKAEKKGKKEKRKKGKKWKEKRKKKQGRDEAKELSAPEPDNVREPENVSGLENIPELENVPEPENVPGQGQKSEPENVLEQEPHTKPQGNPVVGEARKETEWPESSQSGSSQPKPPEPKKPRFIMRRLCDKLKSILQSLCAKLHSIQEKLLGLKEKKDQIVAFFQDDANRATIRLARRQIWKLVKHLLPRSINGRVRFGFDDPYTTGQILTYVSPFYGLYAGKVELIPVFEESVLEGNLQLKGRVRIGTVLAIAGRMLLDKNFRRLLKKLWKT